LTGYHLLCWGQGELNRHNENSMATKPLRSWNIRIPSASNEKFWHTIGQVAEWPGNESTKGSYLSITLYTADGEKRIPAFERKTK